MRTFLPIPDFEDIRFVLDRSRTVSLPIAHISASSWMVKCLSRNVSATVRFRIGLDANCGLCGNLRVSRINLINSQPLLDFHQPPR